MGYLITFSVDPQDCNACSREIDPGWLAVSKEHTRLEPICDECLSCLDLEVLAALWGARLVSSQVRTLS